MGVGGNDLVDVTWVSGCHPDFVFKERIDSFGSRQIMNCHAMSFGRVDPSSTTDTNLVE